MQAGQGRAAAALQGDGTMRRLLLAMLVRTARAQSLDAPLVPLSATMSSVLTNPSFVGHDFSADACIDGT